MSHIRADGSSYLDLAELALIACALGDNARGLTARADCAGRTRTWTRRRPCLGVHGQMGCASSEVDGGSRIDPHQLDEFPALETRERPAEAWFGRALLLASRQEHHGRAGSPSDSESPQGQKWGVGVGLTGFCPMMTGKLDKRPSFRLLE